MTVTITDKNYKETNYENVRHAYLKDGHIDISIFDYTHSNHPERKIIDTKDVVQIDIEED